jgi:hypothetical protein
MSDPRLTGTHHHMFDNIPDAQPPEDGEEGWVFQLDADLKPFWGPPPTTGAGGAGRFYIPFGSEAVEGQVA